MFRKIKRFKSSLMMLLVCAWAQASDLYWLSEPNVDVGLLANHEADEVLISNNGRYITFISKASNLVANDFNFQEDLFIRDLQTGVTELVSVTQAGVQAGSEPIMGFSKPTSDGRYVAFISQAIEFPEANGLSGRMYLKDMLTGELINQSAYGAGLFVDVSYSNNLYLSDDGLTLIFSTFDQLDPLHDNSREQVYLKDLSNDSIQLLSTTVDGLAEADESTGIADVSNNGRYVLLSSASDNLSADVINNTGVNFFILDLQDNSRTLVNITPGGSSSAVFNNSAEPAAISNHAQVVFRSFQSDLVVDDTNNRFDVFLFDSGVVTRINLDALGNELMTDSYFNDLDISGDGGRVVFTEYSDELLPSDTNDFFDLYAYDTGTGALNLVSKNAGGFKANSSSYEPMLNNNGNRVVFLSYATDLTVDPAFSPNMSIFQYRFSDASMTHEHKGLMSPLTLVDDVADLRVSSEQQFAVYSTRSPNLTTEPLDASRDLFMLDRNSQTHSKIGYNIQSGKHDISPSGRYVSFRSQYLQPGGTTLAGGYYVFRYDRQTNTYLQIAEGSNSRVNDDGVVVFNSYVDLVANDTNGQQDVYAYNPNNQQVVLVSEDINGNAATTLDFDLGGENGDVWVTFTSANDLIVVDDLNNQDDVFLKKLGVGESIIRVTETGDGTGADGDSFSPAISRDGQWLAFISSAENLTEDNFVLADYNQVYVFDRLQHQFSLVSLNEAGSPLSNTGSNGVEHVSLSNSGRYVVYTFKDQITSKNGESIGGELPEFAGDVDGELDVVLVDTADFSKRIISRFSDGNESADDVNGDVQVVEHTAVNPPKLGVAFMARRGELTGLSGHPGHREAYLYQQFIFDPDVIFKYGFD